MYILHQPEKLSYKSRIEDTWVGEDSPARILVLGRVRRGMEAMQMPGLEEHQFVIWE